MSEHIANINIDNEVREMTTENTSLFQHIGKYALYDHLFVVLAEDQGIYFWKHHSSYEGLAVAAVEAGAPLHLNIQEPTEFDVNNYLRHVTRDLNGSDTMPEDWVA